MDRRDFLVSILQALFLSLFPWLRTERGAEVLRAAIDQAVAERAIFKTGTFRLSIVLKGFEVTDEMREKFAAIDFAGCERDEQWTVDVPVMLPPIEVQVQS